MSSQTDAVEMPLTNGGVAVIDVIDVPLLSRWKWYGFRKRSNGPTYVASTTNVHRVLMHRLLLGLRPGDGTAVDHINRDGLDNRRCNLRICTIAENGCNRPAQANNTSGYKGVTWNQDVGRWQAQIGRAGGHHYLGLFDSREDAARTYDVAARALHGEFALLNFSEATS